MRKEYQIQNVEPPVELPNPILNLDIENMTYTQLKETVSGKTLTSSATSSHLGFVNDSDYGRGYKILSRAAQTNFKYAYSQANFPKLYDVFSDAQKSFSIIVFLDVHLITDTSSRWGLGAVYDFASLMGWSTGKVAMSSHLRAFLRPSQYALSSYYVPMQNNVCFWYAGITPQYIAYYNANYAYTTNTSYYRGGATTSNGTLVINRAQENSYYAVPNVIVYGFTMYDDILTDAQVQYLVQCKKTLPQ